MKTVGQRSEVRSQMPKNAKPEAETKKHHNAFVRSCGLDWEPFLHQFALFFAGSLCAFVAYQPLTIRNCTGPTLTADHSLRGVSAACSHLTFCAKLKQLPEYDPEQKRFGNA